MKFASEVTRSGHGWSKLARKRVALKRKCVRQKKHLKNAILLASWSIFVLKIKVDSSKLAR